MTQSEQKEKMEAERPMWSEAKPIGPLTVQADELHAILNQLRCTTHYHEEVIDSRLPALERSLTELRSEFGRLLTRQASSKLMGSIASLDNSDSLASGRDSLGAVNHQIVESIEKIHSSRQAAVSEAQNKAGQTPTSDHDALHALRKETIGLRSLVQQLQIEHDNDIMGSVEKGRQLELIRMDLVELHKKAAASVSTIQVSDLQQAMQKTRKDIKSMVDDLEDKLSSEVRQKMQRSQDDLNLWCEQHDVKASQRNEKLRSQFAMHVKSCDFDAFREMNDLDAKHIREKIDKTEALLHSTLCLVPQAKREQAVYLLNRMYCGWKSRQLKRGVATWKRVVAAWKEGKSRVKLRDALLLMVVRRRINKALIRALRRWIDFIAFQRVREQARAEAAKFFVQNSQRCIHIVKGWAFKKWYLIAAADKVDSTYGPIEVPCTSVPTFGSIRSMVRRLGHDDQGVIWMLAREFERLKFTELPSVRKICSEEHLRGVSEIHQRLSNVASDLRERFLQGEHDMTEGINALNLKIPLIDEQLGEHESRINFIHARINQLEDNHEGKLRVLFDHKERSSEHIHDLEVGLKRANNHVNALVRELEKTNELVSKLSKGLEESERRHAQTEALLQERLDDLEARLDAANSLILEDSRHCDLLDGRLEETNQSLQNVEKQTNIQFEIISKAINVLGVRKPSLSPIVSDCMLYEKIAQDKGYVVAINSVSEGGKNLNFPSTIAAFAYDYAAWIAYQADQEAVLRVIVGTNPDEFVYAEDDIDMRRGVLLENLKAELDAAVEDAHPNAGALRLEARTKFVARLIDATDTALSKYDHVIVSAPARVGRGISSVTTCMGCDRPLKSRGRRSRLTENERTEKPASVESNDRPSTGRVTVNVPSDKTFVMRGGFKMPLSSSGRSVPTGNIDLAPDRFR